MYQIKIINQIDQSQDPEVITQQEQEAKDAKHAEIQAQVNAYQIKQQHQLQHGGAGPVAEVEIMKIVNEHAGQFEVIFKQD